MMKKTFITFVLAGVFSVVSCNSDDNSPTVNPYEKFQGIWTGTFSGEDEGTWTVNIDENGAAIGTIESNTMTFPFDLEGQISKNGEVNIEYGNGGKLTGTMTETNASGNWSGYGLQGTWTGTKN